MPVKAADREGKRSTLSVRLTPEGRARLEKAASASGRSLAQEVEMRLEKSFGEDVFIDQLFGGSRHSRNFVEASATAIRRIELAREKRWVDDYGTLWACRRAIEHVMGIVFGYITMSPKCSDDEAENNEFSTYLARLAEGSSIEACRDLGLIVAGPSRHELQHIVAQSSGEPSSSKKTGQ